MEPRAPVVQGQITMAAGGLLPLATGAVHCWRPKTLSRPAGKPKCWVRKASAAAALEGISNPASRLSPNSPAWEIIK